MRAALLLVTLECVDASQVAVRLAGNGRATDRGCEECRLTGRMVDIGEEVDTLDLAANARSMSVGLRGPAPKPARVAVVNLVAEHRDAVCRTVTQQLPCVPHCRTSHPGTGPVPVVLVPNAQSRSNAVGLYVRIYLSAVDVKSRNPLDEQGFHRALCREPAPNRSAQHNGGTRTMRFGILLLILGLGTFVLNAFNYEFRILSWADDYQPWLSIGLAVLGLVFVIVSMLRRRSANVARS